MLALPAEMLGHVMRFVSLADLVYSAPACAALRAAAAPELRPERTAFAALEQICLDMNPRRPHHHHHRRRHCHDPVVLSLRGAVDACRRWGLAPERPFAAVLSRMARRLDVGTVPERQRDAVYADASGLVRRSSANAFFETREASVRRSCIAAADGGPLPVLMPGETVRLWTETYGELVCAVDLAAVRTSAECVCQTSANDNRLVLCVPIGSFYRTVPYLSTWASRSRAMSRMRSRSIHPPTAPYSPPPLPLPPPPPAPLVL